MSVLDAARNMAEDYPGGARALALRIDKNPTTFSHELSETGTAKLGLRDAVKASKRADDLRVLNAFAEEMGCMVLRMPESFAFGDDDAMHLVSRLAAEFNDVVQSFVGAVSTDSDGGQRVTGNEIVEIRRRWAELLTAGQRLVAYAEKVYEEAKPPHLRLAGGGDE